MSHLVCLDMPSRHLLCERILEFFEKRTGYLREKIDLTFWRKFKNSRLNSRLMKINPSIEGSSSVVESSKTRGVRKMISDIIKNTVTTSVSYSIGLKNILSLLSVFILCPDCVKYVWTELCKKFSCVIHSFFQFCCNISAYRYCYNIL